METTALPPQLFAVLLVLDCAQARQETFLRDLSTFIRQRMARHPGYIMASLFGTEDSKSVVEIFFWKDRQSYEQYRASQDGQDAVKWLLRHHPRASFMLPAGVVLSPHVPAIGMLAASKEKVGWLSLMWNRLRARLHLNRWHLKRRLRRRWRTLVGKLPKRNAPLPESPHIRL